VLFLECAHADFLLAEGYGIASAGELGERCEEGPVGHTSSGTREQGWICQAVNNGAMPCRWGG
jgi:hypothetical protein